MSSSKYSKDISVLEFEGLSKNKLEGACALKEKTNWQKIANTKNAETKTNKNQQTPRAWK